MNIPDLCPLHPERTMLVDIKILGPGCTKCQQLEALTRNAVADLRLDAHIDKITDPGEIAAWGVMTTPRSSSTTTSCSQDASPPNRPSRPY